MNRIQELIAGLLITIITVLAPVQAMITTVLLFVAIDTLFALYMTIKLYGLKSLRSSKLFNMVPKSLMYMVSIIALFLTDKFIFYGSIWGIPFLLAKAVALLWIYIEVKSMDETSMKLGNRSIWTHLKNMMNKLKAFKKDINTIMDTGEGNYDGKK